MTAPIEGASPEKTARLRIWRGTERGQGHYQEFDVAFEDGDSVLDGLVRIRLNEDPDLAFRFSCFNANVCKECTMLIDGNVEYACIAKLRADNRHYGLLEELGTRPRTTYLGAVRNPNPALARKT